MVACLKILGLLQLLIPLPHCFWIVTLLHRWFNCEQLTNLDSNWPCCWLSIDSMNTNLTFVSYSDSSNSTWTGLSAVVRNLHKNHPSCHPLAHLAPEARNIYLVAPEPGTDPWDEPLDSDFALDSPCAFHNHCHCAWDDSYLVIDETYFSYPRGPEEESKAGLLSMLRHNDSTSSSSLS